MELKQARGLRHFIDEIRSRRSHEAESRRVTFELAKIRGKFERAQGRGHVAKMLSSYDLKKYACKLIYIRVLGYVIDFGLREATLLMSSTDLAEKSVGYLLAGLSVDASPALEGGALEMCTLVRNDLRMSIRTPGAVVASKVLQESSCGQEIRPVAGNAGCPARECVGALSPERRKDTAHVFWPRRPVAGVIDLCGMPVPLRGGWWH